MDQTLREAGLPPQALAAMVAEVDPAAAPLWAYQAERAVNPASVMKLVTTAAALDLLGPHYSWRTRVYTDGVLQPDGTLRGDLIVRGGGDPKLVAERLWLMLRRVRGLGLRHIAGDLVLDRSAFALPPHDPAAFDGQPLRPYNVGPDALLVNFGARVLTFTPDEAAGVARVQVEPALSPPDGPASVPLTRGPCEDWRAALQPDWREARRLRLEGRFPLACGERVWPVADPAPAELAARAIAGTWLAVGGTLAGAVRQGATPAQATLRLVWPSPPLAEVVRDVNKASQNAMAQHVLLALAWAGRDPDEAPATFEAAQAVLRRWWQQRLGPLPVPEVDNGAGLSRSARLTPVALVRLLQWAWRQPWAPDYVASLPLLGIDGTLARWSAPGVAAHLKSGTLSGVQALAGYVHRPDGRRRVLVAVVNHERAERARDALLALVGWAAQAPA
ncbi:MAG: D-alanyl-D-alanine carboxypeptidase/D-alanyl-D-alanine-endopeptidase [Tepidimonas sp.]|uniref:D-alanyl-D-alanine carboxypeptidase/D-alanyl-D-alanine endopeptidase n=1 Tax=Tepidimonas sp. TaxID=2002775 RepID=UPI00298EE7E9|nr:D-alanyl-D-alanine carboxypeptidase/D-alanyl-D-alanine-endopeptidase [Tepidimonas sp.]MDW8336046.1 D-alanyl-D-alanine carboxypeptidase/D-alanyl-D-alanine-endopeptidase [Tepidimonas sp.]